MAYKKMKLQKGGKIKSTEEGKSLRSKITEAKLSGTMRKYLYNDSSKGSVKSKKKKG